MSNGNKCWQWWVGAKFETQPKERRELVEAECATEAFMEAAQLKIWNLNEATCITVTKREQ